MAENPANAAPASNASSALYAARDALASKREELRARFMRLNNAQKIALLSSIAAAFAVVLWLILYNPTDNYRVLFSNLDDRDAGNITEYLTAQNIPYKIEAHGAILVEEKNVHALRLRLATQGLPRGGHVGFELMENQKFGISQFAEQVNYQRALEGELSKTIEAIASLEKARVHLAIPKPSVFIREDQKPSASVMVKIYPGRLLDSTQIAGITHLIAASVPNMPNENVTIVNQDGSILQEKTSKTIESGLDPVQLSYVKEIELGIVKRIEAILQPVFGGNNFKVQASADIDFSKNEQTAEIYRPNAKPEDSAVRSQQTSESAGVNVTLGGVPGALTNQPPVPAIAPLTQPSTTLAQPSRNNNNNQQPGRLVSAGIDAPLETLGQPIGANKTNTINYEVDKTIRHTKGAIGEIRRLTAAVVVNFKKVVAEDGTASFVSLTDEELRKVESLVKDAMGFNPNRGDSVAVVSSQFSDADSPSVVGNFISAALENPAPIEAGVNLLKYAFAGLILAFLYFKIMRPALSTMFPTAEEERKRAEAQVLTQNHQMVTEEVEEVEYDDEGNVVSRTTTKRRKRKDPEENEEEDAPLEETTEERRARLARRTTNVPYADKLNKARDMAISDPKAVASVVKEWMGINGT